MATYEPFDARRWKNGRRLSDAEFAAKLATAQTRANDARFIDMGAFERIPPED